MPAIEIGSYARARVLVTREAARELGMLISEQASSTGKSVVVDFAGIAGMTPSFVDELLHSLENVIQRRGVGLVVKNPPTRLSAKFAAVARGRSLGLIEAPDGSWIIEPENGSAGDSHR